MKKAITLFFCLGFLVSVSLGQEADLIQVDTQIFNKQVGNSFQSKETGANLLWMKMPLSFEQALPGMKHESNPNITVDIREEMTFGDTRVYQKIGRIIEDDNITMVEVYLIEITDSECIMVTGSYAEDVKAVIGDSVLNAAKSLVRNE